MQKYKKDNQEISYKIIEKNTKYSYIKPKDGYVLITKSKRMPLKFILDKLDENFLYYYNKTEKVKENILYLWDKPYKLEVVISNNFSYIIKADKIIVKSETNDYLLIKQMILKKELNDYLISINEEVINNLSKHNYYQVPLKLKYLTSKYGSYNVFNKNEYIVLNTFLATLKKEFTLYILYHEYTHQKVKNHKKEFYDTFTKLFKEHRKYQKLIKEKRLII